MKSVPEKVRQLLQSEPTQYMIDVCVRTFNNEMNSPNHLSANPTTSEITDKCNEAISREYGSAPKTFSKYLRWYSVRRVE